MDLIVLAKEPVPGRVKTRLCPPCTPEEAARLATAALQDTLDAACRSRADRVVLALDGDVGEWCPAGIEVQPQGDGELAQRLERVWARRAGPSVLIGMDTPQLTTADLDAAMGAVRSAPADGAVLGPAADGGWWLLGAAVPAPGTFTGIPTSRPDTGRRQLARLRALGCNVRLLPRREDVDTVAAARRVAAEAPGTRFAATFRSVLAGATT